MKSLFKLLFASFLTSFSFVAAHASIVETDTVMSQNYVETNSVKASSVFTENVRSDRSTISDLTVRNNITMMRDRSDGLVSPSGEFLSPSFSMYSKPYDGAVVFGIGYEVPLDSTSITSQELSVGLGVSSTLGHDVALNFHAAEFFFDFNSISPDQTGVMNVDGKIVCKEEIRVAEVNTNKVNSDEVNTKGITAKEINVEMNNAADYVFDEAYDLKPLDEVEAFVKSNKHLPGVPSASELKENGMNVSEMSNILLEKVEELTLHLIRLQKEVEQLREENNALKNKR